jgi:hypothetical protein
MMIRRWSGTAGGRADRSDPRGTRTPVCEALEGRQLLSVGAGVVGHAYHLGLADLSHMIGSRQGTTGTMAAPSAAVQADLKTLEADQQTLQSELPASITSAIQADKALIRSVLPQTRQGDWRNFLGTRSGAGARGGDSSLLPFDKGSGTLDSRMTAQLQKAGLTSAQVTQIATDFQNYQNALKTVDPTLSAQITADLAQLRKDGGNSGARW